MMAEKPPLPPVEMRALVGPVDDASFDNPTGQKLFDGKRIFDFGCGCGRVARRLMLQDNPPEEYLGVDLHAGMIRWAQDNLTPYAKQFQFKHLNVYNVGFNPSGTDRFQPLPGKSRQYDVILAHSVFTHILQEEVESYLHEISRMLAEDGIFHSTFFTFDRGDFPMLQDFQNALYINWVDATNATIFDREWLKGVAAKAGLRMTTIQPPAIRGFHWLIEFGHDWAGKSEAEWPADSLVVGHSPPPLSPQRADQIGTMANAATTV